MNKKIAYQTADKLRAEIIGEEEKEKVIRGYPILFDSPAKIGEWTEYIRKGALDGVDLRNLVFLGFHDLDRPLAKAGVNMRAEVDDKGLFIEATLPNTRDADDIYELVSKGIVDGMSYWFDASDVRNDPKTKTSEILKFKWIREVSVVTFPAYPESLAIAYDQQHQPKAEKINKILL